MIFPPGGISAVAWNSFLLPVFWICILEIEGFHVHPPPPYPVPHRGGGEQRIMHVLMLFCDIPEGLW